MIVINKESITFTFYLFKYLLPVLFPYVKLIPQIIIKSIYLLQNQSLESKILLDRKIKKIS